MKLNNKGMSIIELIIQILLWAFLYVVSAFALNAIGATLMSFFNGPLEKFGEILTWRNTVINYIAPLVYCVFVIFVPSIFLWLSATLTTKATKNSEKGHSVNVGVLFLSAICFLVYGALRILSSSAIAIALLDLLGLALGAFGWASAEAALQVGSMPNLIVGVVLGIIFALSKAKNKKKLN